MSSLSGHGGLVNPNSVIANLLKKASLARTTNAFGTDGNTYIQSGQSTKDIITSVKNVQFIQASSLIPQLNTNFNTLSDSIKQIVGAITNVGIGLPAAQAQPQTEVPKSTQQNNQTNPGTNANAEIPFAEKLAASLDTVKTFIGPTGALIGLGLIGLLIVTRGRR